MCGTGVYGRPCSLGDQTSSPSSPWWLVLPPRTNRLNSIDHAKTARNPPDKKLYGVKIGRQGLLIDDWSVPGSSWGLMAATRDVDWVTLDWAETLEKRKNKGRKRVERVFHTWADYGECISQGSTRYNCDAPFLP